MVSIALFILILIVALHSVRLQYNFNRHLRRTKHIAELLAKLANMIKKG